MFKPLKCYLALALTLCLSLTACQNPGTEEPENPDNPEIPEEPETPSSPIVGTWTDSYNALVFRSDGTGITFEDFHSASDKSDLKEIKWVYDEAERTISVQYKRDNGDYENFIMEIVSISENELIYTVGYNSPNEYSRSTTPQAGFVIEPKGQINDIYNDHRREYYIESNSGSYYLDIEPVTLWHEDLPALTLESSTAKYDPIQFNVSGNNPYVLTVSFTENTTANTKFSQIDLVFSNSNKSVSVTCPIVIYQNPAK